MTDKAGTWVLGIFWSGVAVVVAMVAVFLYSGGTIPTTPSATSEFSVTVGDTTYRGKATSDVGVAVMDVITLPSGVVAMVGVYNGQHEAVTLSPSLFEMVDSQGNVYSGSVDLSANDSMSVAAQLNPVFMNMIFMRQWNPGVLGGNQTSET